MTMKTITAKELSEKINSNDEMFILDVRAREKYENDHIQADNIQSINILKSIIFDLAGDGSKPEEISMLPKSKEIIVTCTTGNSARKCALILSEKGYNVTLLDGGITSWKEHSKLYKQTD
ncbi:rhodanese-like domain-containing protein [bacterium LRH843]|nr:rhodanese-like domain-containing protein [bacterium LRH843]